VKNFSSDEVTNRAMSDQFRIAFNEDKVILEAIQRNEDLPQVRRPIRLAIDASPMQMRRMIDRMIEAETGAASGTVTAA
jgi:vanillate O-demethylase monooxygenase subunit